MATVCNKCKYRNCDGTCKTGVLARVVTAAKNVVENAELQRISCHSCRRKTSVRTMRVKKGKYYCKICFPHLKSKKN